MKRAKAIVPTKEGKKPKCIIDEVSFMHLHPSWRFSHSKKYIDSQYGWDHLKGNLPYIVEKLHNLEVQTWNEILIINRERNHSISIDSINSEARKLLIKNKEDVELVYSLRLSSTERLFGIIDHGMFDIMWWDPNHEICPSPKKHT